jgi:hypothetical protein
MTLYRRKPETVEAFHYQSDLETMDFKYPYPDWLEGYRVVRGEFGLDVYTKFGKVTVRPGQWIVNAGNGNIHVLGPEVFHPFAGIGAEVLCEFVGHADKRVGIGRCRFLSRDVGPNCRVLAVEVEPLFEPWLRVGLAAQRAKSILSLKSVLLTWASHPALVSYM